MLLVKQIMVEVTKSLETELNDKTNTRVFFKRKRFLRT